MKFEVIITVWDDGLFKLRDRIEASNLDELKKQIEISLVSIEERVVKKLLPLQFEDDDIPF